MELLKLAEEPHKNSKAHIYLKIDNFMYVPYNALNTSRGYNF